MGADLSVGGARQHDRVAEAAKRALDGHDERWRQRTSALSSRRRALMDAHGLAALRSADALVRSPWRRLHVVLWWVVLGAVFLGAIAAASFLLPSKFRERPDLALFLEVSPILLIAVAGLQLLAALCVPSPRRAPAAGWWISGAGAVLTGLAGLVLLLQSGQVRELDGVSAAGVWAVAAVGHLLAVGLLVLRTRDAPLAAWYEGVRSSHRDARDLEREIPTVAGTGAGPRREPEDEIARRWVLELAELEDEVGHEVVARAAETGPRQWLLACAVAANVPM